MDLRLDQNLSCLPLTTSCRMYCNHLNRCFVLCKHLFRVSLATCQNIWGILHLPLCAWVNMSMRAFWLVSSDDLVSVCLFNYFACDVDLMVGAPSVKFSPLRGMTWHYWHALCSQVGLFSIYHFAEQYIIIILSVSARVHALFRHAECWRGANLFLE